MFIINRSFEADMKTLFEMWVNPEHLSNWLSPKGSTMSYIKTDVREGGTSHYSMTDSEGQTFFGKINYLKIDPPTQLTYTQSFCDKDGSICKPPFMETWPDTLLTTVTFSEESTHATRVTVHWATHGDATDAERLAFHGMKTSMTSGWSGSLDKLEALIS